MPWPWNSCKNLIDYDGRGIPFSGLEGPNEVKFTIGNFQIKKDLLQAARDIAQMYDLFAYRNCQRIQQFLTINTVGRLQGQVWESQVRY